LTNKRCSSTNPIQYNELYTFENVFVGLFISQKETLHKSKESREYQNRYIQVHMILTSHNVPSCSSFPQSCYQKLFRFLQEEPEFLKEDCYYKVCIKWKEHDVLNQIMIAK
jgi:hypothetical protein